MPSSVTNILLTGTPGCGKTTLVTRVVERFGDLRLAGFYTQELRRDGRRVGFEAIGFGGGSTVLAHVEFRSPVRVSRYGVDLTGFEDLIRDELQRPGAEVDVFVVDEIGKMECHSRLFVRLMSELLDGHSPVLATVASQGGGFIREVRDRADVDLVTVTAANRSELADQIVARVQRATADKTEPRHDRTHS